MIDRAVKPDFVVEQRNLEAAFIRPQRFRPIPNGEIRRGKAAD